MKMICGWCCALWVAASCGPSLGADAPAGMYQIQFVVVQRPWSADVKDVATRVLSPEEAAKESEPTADDFNVLSCPTIATVDGAEAYFRVGNEVQYVVGYADGVPQKEQEHQGLTLCVVPHAVDERHVRMEFNYQTARVVGMRKVEVAGARGDQPGIIETPLVQRTLLDVDVDAEVEKFVLLEGIADRDGGGNLCETRVLMRVERK